MRVIPLFIPALAALGCLTAHGASLTEPATVFYGKVTNANAGGQVVHEGTLTWTISAPDGTATELQTALAAQDGGAFSYFLEIPHHVLASGLQPVAGTVPLGSQPVVHRHLEISLDGRPATIDVPGGYEFDLAASARAATIRLDLTVDLPVQDTDGDGMPDWWEIAEGLDPESDDSTLDPDGDGLTNLDEFRRGTGPGTDNRGPELLTSELLAYAGATTGVLLRTADLDSGPAQLEFTLVAVPPVGELRLQGEDPPGLEVGDTFTGEDVETGRLVYHHAEDAPTSRRLFEVRVRDENPAHAAATGEIEIVFFEPPAGTDTAELAPAALAGDELPGVETEREPMVRHAVLGRALEHVVWDFSELADAVTLSQADGLGESNAITGGAGDDDLAGGPAADYITGGGGADRLAGGDSADRFVVLGDDRVADFALEQGDVIDLRSALAGASGRLDHHLQVVAIGSDTELRIDADGDGSGFTDMLVTLEGFSADADGLYTLVQGGHLIADPLTLPPLVRLEATIAFASELGPGTGEFTITRDGDTGAPLVVALEIAGTATNGVDYSSLPASVTIPAGADSVSLPVIPFADNQTEVTEVVELLVQESPDYAVSGTGGVAHVMIENLKPAIEITALEPLASVADGRSGWFLVSRGGDVSPGVLLRFEVGGTASPVTDYQPLVHFLAMLPGQTFALLEVIPRPGATVSGEAETITLSLVPDPSYRSAEPASAAVWLVPELLDFDSWEDEHFAQGGAARAGMSPFLVYGFGLDPGAPFADRSLLPGVQLDDRHLTLGFHVAPAAHDIRFAIEVAGGDLAWRDAEPAELLEVTPATANPGDHVYRSALPIDSSTFQFMRVRLFR